MYKRQYLVKPSPFCILDEVDAPLDDTNIGRFVRVLKEFARTTQFIVVTHNKISMAAADTLDITIKGKGPHAAFPHLGDDVMVAASHLVTALQTVASRTTDPMEAVVVSITQIHAGETYNIIPEEVDLKGTVRTLSLIHI